MIAAYREPERARPEDRWRRSSTPSRGDVPDTPVELGKLGRTLNKRAEDVLAYFDLPGTSNGPTEAINGRLEHLRGTALGFRNLTNYIARSLLDTSRIQKPTTPSDAMSRFGSSQMRV